MENFKATTTCHFQKEGVDLENKKVPVILSDETEVVRYNYSEGKYFLTLKHGEENVDLTRKDILSLFINHDTFELPIGKFENVRLEDSKLKAVAVFDESDDQSMKIFNKLAKGFLQSFSVGVDIISKTLSKEEDGVKYYDVNKWAINEASVVGIPAIPSARVGMNKDEPLGVNPALAQIKNSDKGNTMEYSKETFEALQADHAEALKNAQNVATTDERTRVSQILSLVGCEELKAKSIEEGLSVGDTAIALNKANADAAAKAKVDFEKSSEDLLNDNEEETVDLSEEQQKEKEALQALENLKKDK